MNLQTINRRTLLALAGSAPLLGGCFYGQFFDIEWDEEVLLHDGRVIWVHIKRTFERLGGVRSRWEGVHRDTEISFDAGGKIGRFTRKFERYAIDLLHNKGDFWYLGIWVSTGSPPVKLVTREKSILLLKPEADLEAIATADLPPEIKTFNLMPLTPDSAGIAKFHNKRLSVAEKKFALAAIPARSW